MPLVQGRNLRRRHGHRSHSDYYNFEESLPRDLLERLEGDLKYYRDFFRDGQMKRHEYPQVLDRFSEYEEERVPPSLRRYKHAYDSRGRESLRREEDFLRKHDDFNFNVQSRFVARNKRGSTVHYQLNKKILKSHNPSVKLHPENTSFELEVKEAQNSSICNYTVESIPDTRGSRVPKDLEHVKCNHIGSICQGTGTYCCIQTYKNIEVSYGDGDKETMKLYVGCVCALQVFNNVQQVIGLPLSIND